MDEEPVILEFTDEECLAFEWRIKTNQLTTIDLDKLLGMFRGYRWFAKKIITLSITFSKIKKLFAAKKTEKQKNTTADNDPTADNATTTQVDKNDNTAETGINTNVVDINKNSTTKKTKTPKGGNGRNGADAYTGLPVIHHSYSHENGLICDICKDEYGTTSKLYFLRTKSKPVLCGAPPVSGEKHTYDVYRCNTCNELYDSLPAGIKNAPKYDASCYASIVIHKYQLGVPFYRIASVQTMSGVPLPTSTQWDLVNEFSKEIKPVHIALEKQAADMKDVGYDDTGARVLQTEAKDNNSNSCHTTVVKSENDGKSIVLFYTGLRYAGENLAELMKLRTKDEVILSMSDASSQNFASGFSDDLVVKWIICYCLSHGRRKFHELIEHFPEEVKFILAQIGEIYHHDKICKENNYSAEQRLNYHQIHSKPIMDRLYIWFNNQLLYKQVEANSALGQAITYMLKYWHQLTQFLRVAGAKIDNNYIEQIVKTAILHKKNALFFKTFYGAMVGDMFMSIIQTSVSNKINPFKYLIALKENATQVAATPLLWLPWNYHLQLQQHTAAA